MTDSMKFGPEWLRNMSAEPSVVVGSGNGSGSNNVTVTGLPAGGGGGIHSSHSLHSISGGGGACGSNLLASHSQQTAATSSRNLFPEYRYGREEMLSLFDRNCLLPQILPSFKKLFVDKVQYPLALTPSSEDEMSTQSPIGSSSRPAWLQRSAGGFGISSRGSTRGGTVDRGRMRGKSVYHPIYQRPGALYDDTLSGSPIKPDRNWSERNGIGDSQAVGVQPVVVAGGLDWNGTPSSSPRKEFSSHNRNMENWRRNRNEDGSGDGPNSGNLASIEAAGWRSGSASGSASGAGSGVGIGAQRWGRSTSWRDEENLDGANSSFGGTTAAGVQRSISVIGTVSTERAKIPGSVSGLGVASSRQPGSKWTGSNLKGNVDGDDNLPEWAMENPSEIGGTFDSSGAFHGEISESDSQAYGQINNQNNESNSQKLSDPEKESNCFVSNDEKVMSSQKQSTDGIELKSSLEKESKTTEIPIPNPISCSSNDNFSKVLGNDSTSVKPVLSASHKSTIHGHGDISDRFKEVANEVEKLIMDDDGGDCAKDGVPTEPVTAGAGVGSNSRYRLPNAVVSGAQQQQGETGGPLINQHTEINSGAKAMREDMSHKPMPFSDQLMNMQHHQHHLQQQQQHLSAVLPPHMINANPNDLWFYRDPQTNVQGPFSAMEMTEWYRAGYFNENLFVRRFSDSRFRPLGELIKLCHGNMPFTHSHLLPTPMDLDNLQINLTPHKPSAVNLPFAMPDQQQHRSAAGIDEQLKANVTAAADSLSAAVKGHMNTHTMDTTSHMLTMRFQMLQDQYLQHQEYQILSELSKNESFQRLDAAQREAIVRSKVQMLVLPEYLSSFSGLSNSLAALNPIAGSQLYDAIAQQAKKQQDQQHIFPPNVDQRTGNAGIFLDANNFIINAQLMHQQRTQDQCQPQSQPQPSLQVSEQVPQVLQMASDPDAKKLASMPSTDIDLLNEYNLRMLLRGPAAQSANNQLHQPQPSLVKSTSGVDFLTESQLLAAQMMPIWPPQPPPSQAAQPWPAMPENAKITLWDVATLEEEQNQQLLLQQQQKRHLADGSDNLDFDGGAMQHNNDIRRTSGEELAIMQDGQQAITKGTSLCSEPVPPQIVSQTQVTPNHSSFKQANKQQPGQKHQQGKLQAEEDRRRELMEEKKRLKEERKRQQQEEEKRRALIAEEEKQRQHQEEVERQQQIQAQRRKALLGSQQTSSSAGAGAGAAAGASGGYTSGAGNKSNGGKIEQQSGRSYGTSIAPWSLQSPCVNTAAPGLAEIQKAERRERRADQQRQQEQLDKQMRANAAAAAEANDALLKWQASPAPAPVMSLVDIQAEEAKRLANELMEQQRRREHEQQQQATVSASINVSSSAMSNIWGNANKAWSGVATNSNSIASSSNLWDESKFVGAMATTPTASGGASGGPQLVTNKQQTQLQLKQQSGAALPSPRNLRKSQTLPAMQNVLSKNSKAVNIQLQQQQQLQDKTKVVLNRTSGKSASGGEDKKSGSSFASKSLQQSSVSEYENEFTVWCMKSLDNMSAKVDVPTFVAFLQDLEAPYEVKDYVRIYLGEGKESTDFVKQFLERRSKYKSMQRAQNAHNDDMCKPAPAITPSSNDNGENKNKQKKLKKNKMTKMDARILGFSVTAAEGRINVGSRDYVDGP